MDIKLLHIYPDLMNLYGSYANLTLLRRHLEDLGNQVTVDALLPGEEADFAQYDFIFMGAGTERSQKAALSALLPLAPALRAAAEADVSMLFAGTAMELLGQTVVDAQGQEYPALGLSSFRSVQKDRRIVEDVLGSCSLFEQDVVGFMNKCAVISGVETPLLTSCRLGFGNEAEGGPEGFHYRNVLGSELTGPLLVKNPLLLGAVIAAIYRRRGQALPEEIPAYPFEEQAYAVTAQQLRLRCEKL